MRIIQMLTNKLPKNINYKKCFLISLILIVVGALLIFFIQPQMVKKIVTFLNVAKPGRFVRKKHESKQKFTYKLFLWNVTNPNEIADGTEKPKMEEVGPYVFTHYKQKVNSVDNEAEDTVSYNFWNLFKFDLQSSAPLTGNETVTLLNTVIVASIVKINYESPHLLNILTESMEAIFKNPSSIFITTTAMDFFNNGIEIDCTEVSYSVKVVCAELRRQNNLRVIDDDQKLLRYRWFDKINETMNARYTIMRGSKNIRDVGRVLAVNGQPKLSIFKETEKCNIMNGTDAMFFHPFQKKEDLIWSFSNDACKSFLLRYKYMKTVRGVKTAYRYMTLTDPLLDPVCECNRYIGCSVPGTIDFYNCLGIFLRGSSPHLYLADSSLHNSIEGMSPKQDLHETGVYFDLQTGVPIRAYERFQINFLVKRIPEYHLFSSIAGDVWIPLLWYEEHYTVPKSDLALIVSSRISQFMGTVSGYVMIASGIAGLIITAALRVNQKVSVIPNEDSPIPEKTSALEETSKLEEVSPQFEELEHTTSSTSSSEPHLAKVRY